MNRIRITNHMPHPATIGIEVLPDLPKWPGWYLIGRYPKGDDDGVGAWLLHHGGEAMLLEIPPGLTRSDVDRALSAVDSEVIYLGASHTHYDHFSLGEKKKLASYCYPCCYIGPVWKAKRHRIETHKFSLGGEPLYRIFVAKHSTHDVVTVFRGVAMTGDIELGTLDSVNDEVPIALKRKSFARLARFEEENNYRVHTVVSAHLNDVRENVDWRSLFSV